MRNFITPLKSSESSHQSRNSKDQKSKSPPKMFEDDLGDDFLTSWKPTDMAIGVDLDFRKTQGPKSTLKKTFASKMDMDFDFESGFGKLSSFDVDLSFTSPLSPAKKAKKNKTVLKPSEDEDDDLAFDVKGFNTVDLEDTIVTDNGKSHQFQPSGLLETSHESNVPTRRAGVSKVVEWNQSENLGKGEAEEKNNHVPPTVKESDPLTAQADTDTGKKDTESSSPLLHADLILGPHPPPNTVSFVQHEKTLHLDSKLTPTALGSNAPLLSPLTRDDEADTSISRCRYGLASDFAEKLNSVLQTETRRVGEQSPRPEESAPIPDNPRANPDNSGPNLPDGDHAKHVEQDKPMKQQEPARVITGPRSSIMLRERKEPFTSRNPRIVDSLQFDPLSKSSENTVSGVAQSENLNGKPDNRFVARCLEAADTPHVKRFKNHPQEIITTHSPHELTFSASGPAMTVPIRNANTSKGLASLVKLPVRNTFQMQRSSGDHDAVCDTSQRRELQNVTNTTSKLLPVVAAPSLENYKEMRKDGAEGANFHQKLVGHCTTLEANGSDSISTYAPALSTSIAPKWLGDHGEGGNVMAREDPNVGEVNLEIAPTSEMARETRPKELRGATQNQPKAKLDAAKRLSREFSGCKNKIQSGSKRPRPIFPEENHRDGGIGRPVRTKKGKCKTTVQNKVAGLPSALPPVAEIREGIQVEISSMNAVRVENKLPSRMLTTSKFFSTDGPKSKEREIENPVHIPSPELAKESRLISEDFTSHKVIPMQTICELGLDLSPISKANTLVRNETIARGSEVSDGSDGLQTNRLSRENREIKGIEFDDVDTPILNALPHSSIRTLQNSLPLGPQVQGPSLPMHVEAPVPSGEKVQHDENLPTSAEIHMENLHDQGPADSLIFQNDFIVEQSIQHTNKLEAMLKALRKLNDSAKNLLVRALVANNKLMMLTNPLTEDKIIKVSVMKALGTDRRDEQL